jgi:hypothetical protein
VHMTVIVFGRVCSLQCQVPNMAEKYNLLSWKFSFIQFLMGENLRTFHRTVLWLM